MSTWSEVQSYARNNYSLEDDQADEFSLVFEYENQRAQLVGVRQFEAGEKAWIEFFSACCEEGQLPSEEAMKLNGQFVMGGLVLIDGLYVFRYSVPLVTLDKEEFEIPLHLVAATADRIEAAYTQDDRF